MNGKPELLSPAGTLECALAAFDGGADAVYCGFGRFNARERAGNFTFDDMGKLIAFARKNGKKVYLTLNTLLKEKDLSPVMELLDRTAQLKPDALIVQDAGLVQLTRTYCPCLRLHASTQMGFHNSAGLRVAGELGFRRVILERQVTLSELRKMMADAPLEVEVFIYGSLCCSLSGRCLFSLFTDGESGNRGRCKQPCRRQWGGKYLFSPADLDGTMLLPELRKLGVASLKIEGRLRPPEYVWKTARAFRILLDGPVEPEPELLKEAQILLRSAAGRVSSPGFFVSSGRKNLIQPDRPGCFGIPVAEVLQNKGGVLQVRAVGRMHLGDRLRVVPQNGGDGESFSLIRLVKNFRPAETVRAGDLCRIPFAGAVKTGDKLFKIGENGFDFSRRARTLPSLRHGVSIEIEASANLWRGRASCGKEEVCWQKETAFLPPEKFALSEEMLSREFAGGVPEPWYAEQIQAKVKGDFFVPAGELKKIRREFWDEVSKKLAPDAFHDTAFLLQFYRDYRKNLPPVPSLEKREDFVIPGFCGEDDLPLEIQKIREAYRRGIRRFRVCGWYGLELLKKYRDIEIVTDFPIAVANSAAAEALRQRGVLAVTADPELAREEADDLRAHSPVEVWISAQVPVLATRLRLPAGEYSGIRGDRVEIRYDAREKLTLVHALHCSRNPEAESSVRRLKRRGK